MGSATATTTTTSSSSSISNSMGNPVSRPSRVHYRPSTGASRGASPDTWQQASGQGGTVQALKGALADGVSSESPLSHCPIPAQDWRGGQDPSGQATIHGAPGIRSPWAVALSGVDAEGGVPASGVGGGTEELQLCSAVHKATLFARSSSASDADGVPRASSVPRSCTRMEEVSPPPPASGSPGLRRKSMSAIGRSAAEEQMEEVMQQQLRHAEKRQQRRESRLGSSSVFALTSANGSNSSSSSSSNDNSDSGPFPGTNSKQSSNSCASSRDACGRLRVEAAAEDEEVMKQEAQDQLTALDTTTSLPTPDVSSDCVNWTEVEELCANMDIAGVRIEDVDIMCLAGEDKGAKPANNVLLSLKFSSMTLRHYPGNHDVKKLFHQVISS